MKQNPSDTKIDIKPQIFTIPSRIGKTVVEWGGNKAK